MSATCGGATVEPPAGPLSFEVRVSFSEKAAAKLAAISEKIFVAASYSGDANAAGKTHRDEIGRIDLGTEKIEAKGEPGTIRVTGRRIERRRLAWVDGPVLLNVNIYSARLRGPDNILACDFFDGTVEGARRGPISLHCSLITENVATTQKQ